MGMKIWNGQAMEKKKRNEETEKCATLEFSTDLWPFASNG